MSCYAFLIGGYRFGSARRDDTSAVGSSARAEVDDVVGVAYHVQIVFDDDQGSPCRKQMPEDFEQCPDVERVEPDGGLVENEERVALPASHLRGEFQPLRLAARETGRGFAEGEVAQPEVAQRRKPRCDALESGAQLRRMGHVGLHDLRQREQTAVPTVQAIRPAGFA